MTSIKDFAATHGKTVQSVYKQIKGKENAEALKGHIIEKKIGNRPAKFLDDEAVRILEAASAQSPQVVVQTGDKEKIEQLEAANKLLLAKVADLQDQLLKEKDQVKQLQEDKIKLLEAKKEEPEKKGFFARLFGR